MTYTILSLNYGLTLTGDDHPPGTCNSNNLTSDNMDYKLTEEYRDRFAMNHGERYWIDQAVRIYLERCKQELADDSIITAGYLEQLFKDINSKLDQWTD